MRVSDWRSDLCSSDLSSVREPLMEFPRAAFDPVVQQLAVGTHGPDCRPGDLDRPPVGREAADSVGFGRSEERRVGKECISTFRYRWSPSHYENTQYIH